MASASATIPVGYKQTEVGVIPSDWQIQKLGDICKFSTGSGLLKGEIKASGKIPAIPYTALYTDFSEILDYELIKWFVDDISLTHVVSEPCVLIASSSNMEVNTGKASALTESLPVALGREIIILKTKYDTGYISYLLSTELYRRRTLRLVRGTTIKHLYTATFYDYTIAVPSRSEQIAIAKVLFDVDALIKSLEKLIAKKHAIKTATMQELLTGKTRLPGFSGEWETKQLEELCRNFVNGGTPSTQKLDYWNGTIPWITGADILQQRVAVIKRYITNDAVKNSSTNVIEKNELLIVTRTGVGKLAIAPFPIAISQDFTGVQLNKQTCDVGFLFNYLNYKSSVLRSMNQGTSIAGITRESLAEMPIEIPEIGEQEAIAEVLSDMDAEITTLEQRLEKTKAIKQGMMQQLLTGRIRLVDPSTPVEASA